MTSSAFFALALLLPAVVSAANDWKTPCLNGTCSYDLHNGTAAHGVAGGSVYLVSSLSLSSTEEPSLTPDVFRTVLPVPSLT